MRIAHIDSEKTWRGGQAQVLGLITGLESSGVSNVLYSPPGPLRERVHDRGIPVRPFSALSDFDLFSAARLGHRLREEKVDLVHTHSGRAHAVGALAAYWADRLPVVVSRRVDFSVAGNPLSAIKYRHGVHRYLCISRAVRRILLEGGVEESKIRIVPSGIDLSRWDALPDPTNLRQRLGIREDQTVVGSLAALAPHKDHSTLLRAAKELRQTHPNVCWVIFGEGECRSDLERERRNLGLDEIVLLPGFVEEVGEAMALLKLFVLSSYLEGLGTSILDAQAAGVPVVATRVGGVPEMIEDGVNGWLVPARDPRALAEKVGEALTHLQESDQRARRARESVKRFSLDETVAKTSEAYREVLRELEAASG